MSAPTPRGARGGSVSRGSRGVTSTSTHRGGRGGSRASANISSRARGRGRGTSTSSASSGEGLLQKLRTGTLNQGQNNGTATASRGRGATRSQSSATVRGGGRGAISKTFNEPSQPSSPDIRSSSPAPTSSYYSFMQDMTTRWQSLKQKREAERAKAIRDGFLADPEKKTSLDKAITPVGTCTEMCPLFERVERIVQNMVDKAEKIPNDAAGRDLPSEERMVKRFRRSAAGNDEQLPSDIRTPQTLKETLDYLFDKVIGGPERLASIHKFVWDRTRAIRNDFSIQQVTKQEDVKIAVQCYERIARFHIMSLHQLSNPDNLLEGENFDAHQEREQLNNTLLSLMYYYDDHRDGVPFPNEAEFRAYCIIFELQSQHPDLEDRMQAWPDQLLNDQRIQTAFKLYAAAGNTLFDQGPLRPMTPFLVAQNNSGRFWTLLSSKSVSYMMACVAEIYFPLIRFAALDALWRSGKSAPPAQQTKSQDWTVNEITSYLGFDTEEQTFDFCAAFDLSFRSNEHGEQYLDFTAFSSPSLDKTSMPNVQVFSHAYVEDKRFHRSIVAVMNGFSVSQSIRNGLVGGEDEQGKSQDAEDDDDQSMFIPENPASTQLQTSSGFPAFTGSFGSRLNPEAASFAPKFGEPTSAFFPKPSETSPSVSLKFGESASKAHQPSLFGQTGSQKIDDSGTTKPSFFASPSNESTPSTAFQTKAPEDQLPLKIQSSGQQPFLVSGSNTSSGPKVTASTSAPVQESFPATSINSTNFDFGKPFPPSAIAATSPLGGFGINQPKTSSITSSPLPPPPTSVLPPSIEPTESTTSSSKLPPTSLFSQPQPQSQSSEVSSPFKFTSPSLTTSASATQKEPPAVAQAPFFNFSGQAKSAQDSIPSGFSALKTPFTFPSADTSSNTSSNPEPPSNQNTPPAVTFSNPPTTLPTTSSPAPFSFPSSPLTSTSNDRPVQQPQPKSSRTPPPAPTVTDCEYPAKSPSPRSTTPPQSPPRQPSGPRFTEADKAQLIDTVAQLSLCQPDGLVREYLEYILPGLVREVVEQRQKEIERGIIHRIKTQYLFRKFGALWRKITWRNNLNRRAVKRRQLFAETMRADQEKKKRDEAELEEILQAAKDKKRLQAEIRQAGEEQKRKETEALRRRNEQVQLAGSKRKSPSATITDNQVGALTTGRSFRQHKRSRTVGSAIQQTPQRELAHRQSTSGSYRASIYGGSIFRASSNSASKVDQTQTDYFELLSRGIDPETPLIPLTAQQVEKKKEQEAHERQQVVEKTWNRRRITPQLAKSPTPQDPSHTSSPQVAQPPSTQTKFIPKAEPQTDDLLRQLREAREAMAGDAQWFKEQTAMLEQEIVHEEKLRTSLSSSHSARISVNGLPMANGYEYMPAPEKPGIPLSRTERRIRATGAHGLAYKPIGGTSDYAPVAMSKRSAMRYSQNMNDAAAEAATNGTAKKRRRHREFDRAYQSEENSEDSGENEQVTRHTSQKRARIPSHSSSLTRHTSGPAKKLPRQISSTNPFSQLQHASSEASDDEEVLDEEDQDDIVNDGDIQGQYDYSNGVEGDTEECDDQDEEEADEEDFDEDDEDEEDNYQHGLLHPKLQSQHGYGGYEDAPTPHSTQMSRASSGPGASVDDALVLSD